MIIDRDVLPSVVAGVEGDVSASQQKALQNKWGDGSRHFRITLAFEAIRYCFHSVVLPRLRLGQGSVQLLTSLSRNTCFSVSSF